MLRSFVVGLLVVISDGLILGQLAVADPRPQQPGPVCLAVREVNPLQGPPQAGGLLVREIVRQAFLIAARDECGLSMRDQTLRESLDLPAHANSTPFATLVATPIADGSDTCHVRVSVTHGNGKAGKPLWETTIDIPRYDLITVLVDKAEAWSRKEFEGVLAQAGPTGKVPAARSSAAIPQSAETRLWAWNEIAVFTALRQLHAEIREHGESPELLAGLVVGYANLGLMTEMRWSAAHKAFKARALLYAERLVRKSGSSGWRSCIAPMRGPWPVSTPPRPSTQARHAAGRPRSRRHNRCPIGWQSSSEPVPAKLGPKFLFTGSPSGLWPLFSGSRRLRSAEVKSCPNRRFPYSSSTPIVSASSTPCSDAGR